MIRVEHQYRQRIRADFQVKIFWSKTGPNWSTVLGNSSEIKVKLWISFWHLWWILVFKHWNDGLGLKRGSPSKLSPLQVFASFGRRTCPPGVHHHDSSVILIRLLPHWTLSRELSMLWVSWFVTHWRPVRRLRCCSRFDRLPSASVQKANKEPEKASGSSVLSFVLLVSSCLG